MAGPVVCSACGAAYAPDGTARFACVCGAPVSRPPPEPERRTSRLAFASLVLACLAFAPPLPLFGAGLGMLASVRVAARADLRGAWFGVAATLVGLLATGYATFVWTAFG